MHSWFIGNIMRRARDAYWFGATDHALDLLMEIAQEEINDHVQETFDLACQPRPARKKQSALRPNVNAANDTSPVIGCPPDIQEIIKDWE